MRRCREDRHFLKYSKVPVRKYQEDDIILHVSTNTRDGKNMAQCLYESINRMI